MGKGSKMVNLEEQAGRTLLDEGAKFGIKIWGKERMFAIKPLKLGTIIAISKEVAWLKQIKEDEEMVPAILSSADNLKSLSNVVALAVLNSKGKNRFAPLLGRIFLNRLTTKELFQLSALVVKQMSVEDFFFTMRLIGGASILKSSKEAGEEKASGEELQE